MIKIFLISTILVFQYDMFGQDYKSVDEAKGLQVGQNAPLFSALDEDSTIFKLSDAIQKGSVVVIFYRGHWCPYCNKHLARIQDSLQLISNLGATVIAISPQKPEYSTKTAKKSGASFRLLYDEDYMISNSYDVTFKPPEAVIFKYNTLLNANLKKAHSDESQQLPIPATYIINKEGKIIWRQFNPNYKIRSSVKDILEVIKQIS